MSTWGSPDAQESDSLQPTGLPGQTGFGLLLKPTELDGNVWPGCAQTKLCYLNGTAALDLRMTGWFGLEGTLEIISF